jgi:hypothetical protein
MDCRLRKIVGGGLTDSMIYYISPVGLRIYYISPVGLRGKNVAMAPLGPKVISIGISVAFPFTNMELYQLVTLKNYID